VKNKLLLPEGQAKLKAAELRIEHKVSSIVAKEAEDGLWEIRWYRDENSESYKVLGKPVWRLAR
jgi:hypothetical protein